METLKNSYKIVIGVVLGLIVGFGAGFLIFERGNNGDTASDESKDVEEDDALASPLSGNSKNVKGVSLSGIEIDDGAVEVKDQAAGKSVFISRVTAEKTVWVAIHDDMEGSPGNILGARRFDAGVNQLTMNLLRETLKDKEYHAMLWVDDGDRKFDHEADSPAFDSEGKWIGITFEAY